MATVIVVIIAIVPRRGDAASAGRIDPPTPGPLLQASPIVAAAPRVRPWLLGDGRWMPIAAGCVAAVWLLALVLPDARSRRPPPPPPLRAAPAVRAIPPGGQAAIGTDEASWISADDYPAASLDAGETGKVTVRWRIGVDGDISNCGVVKSSSFPRLDHAACDAIVRNGAYRPARDAAGWPVAVTRERRVVWQIPR